ncbi:MaoC family dehydratase [Sphingomonas nostoxanthinifaciens]|uniref:MaoC family dehydratase n=1 Tax=Sphingomonas nostoxanthinifaciens TaxID=2872652 RepID=UPI001CC1DFA7|nr:MaoC family dehydratase [Sphingomonas nostoxanthinifaciens]UAK24961.1 MaoC family dehydratase [Sphingomonas nostoxanthinifaciens]
MQTLFEDLEIGRVDRFGHYDVTEAEVLDFARRYDAQPFHLDAEAAAANPIFGRVAASGWHTASMAMAMTVEHWRAIGFASLGSPGLDELSWLKPVYPGDTLRIEAEVMGLRLPSSLAGIGFAKVRTIVFNQADEPVMRQVATIMVGRRAE